MELNYLSERDVTIYSYHICILQRFEIKLFLDQMIPYLPNENREWLRNALMTTFPDSHEWSTRLEGLK